MSWFRSVLALMACALLSPGPCHGDQALALGDALAAKGAHEAAITEFKRFLCFHQGDQRLSGVYVRIAHAHRAAGNADEALDALQRAIDTAQDDRERDERRLDRAVLQMATQETAVAEFEIVRVAQFSAFPETRARALFDLGLCYLLGYRWGDASATLSAYADAVELPVARRQALLDYLSPSRRPRLVSPGLAASLSSVVPGAGQVYCGKWGNGLHALALNAATGSAFVPPVLNGDIGRAVSWLPFFWRFYRGNRTQARALALATNERRNQAYLNSALGRLEECAEAVEATPGSRAAATEGPPPGRTDREGSGEIRR